MRYQIKVIPNSKTSEVRKETDGFRVRLKSPAKEGKANIELIEVLSDFFGVPKYCIEIKSGHSSKNKIIEIT